MRDDPKTAPPDSLATCAREDDTTFAMQPAHEDAPQTSSAAAYENAPSMQDDWTLADQSWRDWRTAMTAHHDPQAKTLIEQAWAAGLIDGAAIIVLHPGDDPDGTSPRMALEIREGGGEQGRINLTRFQLAVGGAGSISGPYPEAWSASSYYLWQATREVDIDKVWQATGPFLGLAKFAEFRRALAAPTPGTRPVGHEGGRREARPDARDGRVRTKGKQSRRRNTG